MALSIPATSSTASRISPAPAFSFSLVDLLVPGIGTIRGFLFIIHAK